MLNVARFLTCLSLRVGKFVTNLVGILTHVREIRCCMFPLCMRRELWTCLMRDQLRNEA
jgi:hypothetical protein